MHEYNVYVKSLQSRKGTQIHTKHTHSHI